MPDAVPNVGAVGDPIDDQTRALLRDAIAPLVESLGGMVVSAADVEPSDLPVHWDGHLAVGVRITGEGRDVAWHLATIVRELGCPLTDLDRVGKQGVVRLLNERGAFQLRRSVEQVAEELGVSRFTVYNYLNRP